MNKATITDPFPTPYAEDILQNISGSKFFSFMDGFSGYNQIKIAVEDRHKTTFTSEWGSFAYTVMPFGLKNAPAVFSRIVVKVFQEFIHKFLEAYFDDWIVYGLLKDHIK